MALKMGVAGAGLAAVLLAAPGLGRAAEHDYWAVGYADDKSYVQYVDVSSFKRTADGHVRFWTVTVFQPGLQWTQDSQRTYWEANCQDGSDRWLSTVVYSPSGAVTYSKEKPADATNPFKPQVPESVGEQIEEFVCAAPEKWSDLGDHPRLNPGEDVVALGHRTLTAMRAN